MAGPILSLHKHKDFKKLVEQLAKNVQGSHVKVGVLGDEPREDGKASNLEVAIYNEFGTSKIPERSFLRSAFKKHEREYVDALGKLIKAHIERGYDLRRGLDLIGQKMVSDVRAQITEGAGIPPPNAPATVARKKSDRPLVDTGQLIDSIAHKVKIGGAS